ncbi:MAG: uroporphyrinogen-III C-methyltransferase [Propionicimonas sp.]
MMHTGGRVVLVGGGPGDPDLITVGGLRAIREADVIAYDRLAPLEVLGEARPDALLIDVGKEPHGAQTTQERIHELLLEHARAGRVVVRLKGGDGYVFGRGGEEALACAEAGVPVRVIPGVTSAIAAPALAGIPVTHRSLTQGFTVVTGHVPPGDERSTLDWAGLARLNTTLVILMGTKHLPEIVAALVAGGKHPAIPAAIVEKAGSPQMRVVRATVGSAADAARAHGIRPPAIVVIGEVAALDLAAPAWAETAA